MIGQLVDLAGWVGAAALLLGYGLASSGRLEGRSAGFQALNLVGSVGLLVNSTWHGAWPSAALNGVWLVIGTTALSRLAIGSAPRSRPSGDQPSPLAAVSSGRGRALRPHARRPPTATVP